MPKNIVVVGGGTAGWIAALSVIHRYPNFNVTVIESDEIGILGAGEGTTPNFLPFLHLAGITAKELVINCDATIKNGIEFKNWHGDNTSYFHSFQLHDDELNVFSKKNINILQNYVSKNENYKFLDFQYRCSTSHLTPLYVNENKEFDRLFLFSLHFNARKVASYFKSVAISKNIKLIEGKVNKFSTDENNYITEIHLENLTTVKADFVFDCTGFARLILGKLYKTKWKSYSHRLPMNSAVPFFIPHNNIVKPQTSAIAMKYGWIWQIPVRDRYGCGYVFDKNYISADTALNEAEEYFGMKLESPKTFQFEAGSFEKVIVNNCMALGLSHTFIEPLEATSIMSTLLNLNLLLDYDIVQNNDDKLKNFLNQASNERNDEILEFLNLHYQTNRNDSEFWANFKENYPISEYIKDVYSVISNGGTTLPRYYHTFGLEGYLQVGLGVKIIDKNFRRFYNNTYSPMDEYDLFSIQNEWVKKLLNHQDIMNET